MPLNHCLRVRLATVVSKGDAAHRAKIASAMAIDVRLQTEMGEKKDEVLDICCSLTHLWPCGDQSFPLLQYIDPYGSTVFNRPQMPEVQKELDILISCASSDEQRDVIRQIRNLAVRCQEKPHLFLRFIGD